MEEIFMIEISIVIPNYNGKKFLAPCLDSLRLQSFTDFEILIVDNGSVDDSLSFLKEQYEEVRCISLNQNYGFSKAVNEGIKAASASFVILLNNDTTVERDFVRELYTAIQKSEQIFSCSAKMVTMADPAKIDDAGDFYTALGWAFAKGKGKNQNEFQKPYPIFASCAGAAIYRKERIETLGYFDEKQFAYLEDIDIGYRARIHGYQNMFVPTAVCHHVGSGASGSRYNEFKVKLSSRNSVYIIYKNMPVIQVIGNLPFLTLGFLIKYLFFLKKGFGTVYIRGLLCGIQMCVDGKKETFRIKNSKNYIVIQWELWVNTIRRFLG